jgi:hypothetical protein
VTALIFAIASSIHSPFLLLATLNHARRFLAHQVNSNMPRSSAFLKCQCAQPLYFAKVPFNAQSKPASLAERSSVASICEESISSGIRNSISSMY